MHIEELNWKGKGKKKKKKQNKEAKKSGKWGVNQV